jgi:hypothetical protein
VPTDLFKLSVQWGTRPQDGALLQSGAAAITAPIQEYLTLDEKNLDQYQLTSDSPQAVGFGGVANANVLIVSSDRKVMVQVTSADGTAQAIPCDDQLIVISRTVPITAVSLTRVPATLTNVSVFLGESA